MTRGTGAADGPVVLATRIVPTVLGTVLLAWAIAALPGAWGSDAGWNAAARAVAFSAAAFAWLGVRPSRAGAGPLVTWVPAVGVLACIGLPAHSLIPLVVAALAEELVFRRWLPDLLVMPADRPRAMAFGLSQLAFAAAHATSQRSVPWFAAAVGVGALLQVVANVMGLAASTSLHVLLNATLLGWCGQARAGALAVVVLALHGLMRMNRAGNGGQARDLACFPASAPPHPDSSYRGWRLREREGRLRC